MARTTRRRPDSRLYRWQTLLAAAVAAAAAIVVAFIQAGDENNDDGGGDNERPAAVGISRVVLMSATPPPLVRILGTATGLSSDDLIYVVARPEEDGTPEAEGGGAADAAQSAGGATQWIASDPAERSDNGRWQVDFRLPPEAVLPLAFVAVIYPEAPSVGSDGDSGNNDSDGETLGSAGPTQPSRTSTGGRPAPSAPGGARPTEPGGSAPTFPSQLPDAGGPDSTGNGSDDGGSDTEGEGFPEGGGGQRPVDDGITDRLETSGPEGLTSSAEVVGP